MEQKYLNSFLSEVHSKLEDDIFDLFTKLKEVLLIEDISSWGINTNLIYKKYEEDFWRVRE